MVLLPKGKSIKSKGFNREINERLKAGREKTTNQLKVGVRFYSMETYSIIFYLIQIYF